MSKLSRPRRARARIVFGVGVAAIALLAAGCGDDDDSEAAEPGATQAGEEAQAATSGDGPQIFVIGGKADDPFWSVVKRGAEDAAAVVEASGGSMTWLGPDNYDNLGPDAAQLIRNAIAQDADVIIGANWVPEAENEAFQAAVDAGIPVFIYNAGGIEAADELGAVTYIGSEEHTAGVAGGQFFGEHGATNVLCVNTLPGAANTEARCAGIAEGIAESGGTSEQLPLPSSNFGDPTAVSQAIAARLVEDDSIDGIVTISAGDADSAASAIQQAGAGDRVALGSFDNSESGLDRIQGGTQLFSIDQQPYLQGYLAVSLAFGYQQYGLELPQRPLLTGPAIVSSDNVETVIAGVAAGTR
jgi:simple sugar transport system substrate-binding protein